MTIPKLTQDMLDEMVMTEIGAANVGKEGERGKKSVRDLLMAKSKEKKPVETMRGS